MTYRREIIQKQIQLAAPEVRSLIGSDALLSSFAIIAQKYSLNSEMQIALGRELAYVLLGLTNLREFPKFIEQELRVSTEIAKQIFEDISTQILAPVKKFLFDTPVQEQKSSAPIAAVEQRNKTHSPPEIQNLIASSEMTARIQKIQTNHNLRVDEASVLAEEALKLMEGTTRPYDFYAILKFRLGQLGEEKVQQIANDVNKLLLRPIRDALKTIQGRGTPQKQASTIAPPLRVEPAVGLHASPLLGVERTMPKDIAEAKLREQIQIPHEVAKMTNEKLDTQRNLPNYGIDPYREPIA